MAATLLKAVILEDGALRLLSRLPANAWAVVTSCGRTLDQGAALSPFTVAREMGHGGTRLVHQVYGYSGTVRHRAKVVEYRVAQHRAKLGDRLKAARAGGL